MKIFTGKVIAKKTDKTATVAVERMSIHPLYKKRFKRIKKYQVHDETGVKTGDRVTFADSRPYSKNKKWKIIEVVVNKKGRKSN
jgi:small subunit ribosomal protein S17